MDQRIKMHLARRRREDQVFRWTVAVSFALLAALGTLLWAARNGLETQARVSFDSDPYNETVRPEEDHVWSHH